MKRTPIVGLRKPIQGIERIPIRVERIPWDDVYKKYVNYIKFAAKSTEQDYNNNMAEDLFQEGQLVMYNCYLLYGDKPMEEFGAILKASVWRKMREICNKKQFIQVDIEDAYDIGYDEDTVEDIYQEQKLAHLASMLKDNPIALTILREFVFPSVRTLWEAKMDVARKEMLRSQDYKVSVPKCVQPTKLSIWRAMEIPKSKFEQHFKDLKEAVLTAYPEYSLQMCM